jgi:hypothetical protein
VSDEFTEMFDKLSADKANAEAKAKKQADEARAFEEAGFATKAECLVKIVLPTLQQAKASLAEKGVDVTIEDELQPGNASLWRNPTVKFYIQHAEGGPGKRVPARNRYFVTVTHTQGGVQFGSDSQAGGGRTESVDLSKHFGVGKASELSREQVVKFFQSALKDSL